MLRYFKKNRKGFTLIELLIVVAIIGILAAIAIPNLMSAQRRSKYSRAASDTKTATTQAIVYANDLNIYPTNFQDLRLGGYANVPDADPWSTAFEDGFPAGAPAQTDNVWSCSLGPDQADDCPVTDWTTMAFTDSVGYSAIYGNWSGK